jgi:regulator of replication initiation timing
LVPVGVFDQIGVLDKQHTADQEEVTTLQLALTEQYEENLSLQEEVTTTQLALTEIYEEMEA